MVEVIDFSERCGFCGRKTDKKDLKPQVYADRWIYQACPICKDPMQQEDDKVLAANRKAREREERNRQNRINERRRLQRRRRRRFNPYTNKKYCKLCSYWMNKSNWKKHNETKRHAKNLFKEMESSKTSQTI
jgi:hypothetical protein